MEPRSVLRSLREFAERELREKRADRVRVCRVKAKSLLRRGRLPDLRVLAVEGIHYLICVFSDGALRIYYMDKRGKMLGAEDFTGSGSERVQERVLKETKSMFCLQSFLPCTQPPSTRKSR